MNLKEKEEKLGSYMKTVMQMMKQRHPECQFTLMANFDTGTDAQGDPTIAVALVSNEPCIPAIIDHLNQVNDRVNERMRRSQGDSGG